MGVGEINMTYYILIILAVISIIGIVGLVAIPLVIYNIGFGHRHNNKDDGITLLISDFSKLRRKKVKFKSNKKELIGYIYNYNLDVDYKGIIIIVNGHSNTQNNYLSEIDFFTRKGYLVLSYDGTGCGESEGRMMKGYPQWVYDLNNVLSVIESEKQFKNLNIYLFGHSIGGYAAVTVLNFSHPRIKAVVSCSGINSGKEYVKHFSKQKPCLFSKYMVLFFKYYERLLFGKMADYTAAGGINNSNTKVMIIHSKDDTSVPMNCSILAYKNEIRKDNVEFILLENKSHFVFKSEEAIKYLTSKDKKNDRSKVRLIDYDIMNRIDNFFESAR